MHTAGGKDCEEETLQTAFKKLRVDAESLPGAVSVSEVLAPRAAPRPGLDASGAKPKISCPKDSWHGSMRKTSKGASRTQRRRRSKSPILHPPKFTYCSSAASSVLSTSSGCLKHQRLAVPEPTAPCPAVDGRTASSAAQKELSSSATTSYISPLVFGSCAGHERLDGAVVSSASAQKIPSVITAVATSPRQDGGSSENVQNSSDFQEESRSGAESQCQCHSHPQAWHGVEVYSFTGLRSVISECERSLLSHADAPRTLSSPRSCSEQARAYVDDITIEDLSGYLEYYLYIPKKMSHMAEMMYT
uniref:Oxidative stress-responsive serine-rich protein 1 n=1 Tax=Monopterus albus TaxID=43700 RepID=A0A3Q3R8X2_MONAL